MELGREWCQRVEAGATPPPSLTRPDLLRGHLDGLVGVAEVYLEASVNGRTRTSINLVSGAFGRCIGRKRARKPELGFTTTTRRNEELCDNDTTH